MSTEQLAIPEIIKKAKKLTYLEGIRGLAAFMVVIHHYLLAFYPAQASGDATNTHFGSLELWYYKSPFIFLTNGQLFVFVFFILSGYVLSKKFFLEKDMDYLVSASLRRFPRLYIPVAFTLIIAFILLKFSLNFNSEASNITKSLWFASLHGKSSITHFLSCLFYRTMFIGDNTYNTVLWTISQELFGSFLVFAALALTRNAKNSFIIYVLLFVLFVTAEKFEYCAFIFGIMLNYTDSFEIKKILHKRIVIVLLLLAGLFLGGFPHVYFISTPTLNGTIYSFLNYSFIIKRDALLNATGAFLLILAVQQSTKLQHIFSSRALAFLGYISFAMYLIHVPVLQSFSSFLFIKNMTIFSYNVSFLIGFILSLVLIFFASYIMTIYVDKKSLTASQSIYKRFFSYKQS
ncbi:MAG: Peptidoglycan/LPS O-acetylase OafA/YrhL, contains acyltransferase and SGNH-hydrolase domain [Mucilaginibacter sp.]|nr:Peptidoglycan/LPS O-acetylase OafA/YrhL, contains acyltransferase and SGNH-hydrolase domain [Mucilaginibacter sp.]